MDGGYWATVRRVKDGAEPIDNATKWAWADSDYEEAEVWREYTTAEIELINKTTIDDIAGAVADASAAVSANAEDLSTLADALAELSALVSGLSEKEASDG